MSGASPAQAAASVGPSSTSAASAPAHLPGPEVGSTATSKAFDQRVDATAEALESAGVPRDAIRLPYVGPSAELRDGAVLPGYAVTSSNVSSYYTAAPAPYGIAYYGENDSSGRVEATEVNASSLAGTLTVNSIDALYLDVDTPDMWGIQLNSVLGNVTLHGVPGYEFWTQNAVDVFQSNNTINLGEDTWNFSSSTAYLGGPGTTILSHDPNGSITGGLYIGFGPWLYAPQPFSLTLYVNSSVTSAGDQELWYNYSLDAAGGIHHHGNYDWIVFDSGPVAQATVAPFVADGRALDPVGLPNDFEFDYAIGGYNGATMDVLSANLSATLDYCPLATGNCTSGGYVSVPAAVNFGAETGETSSGVASTFVGTTEYSFAGPFVLRGLWGYADAAGAVSGDTAVANAISTSGAPDPGSAEPYFFVFLYTSSAYDDYYEWAPDTSEWYLPAGTYDYSVMLADYAEVNGTLVVGGTSTELLATLPYDPAAGVYTPLWALSNAQLAGISTSGTGALNDQYRLFDNAVYDCTGCGGAANGNLSEMFLDANDFLFPEFVGILLDGTSAYVDIASPPTFTVLWFDYGLYGGVPLPWASLDLQIQFYDTEHVTLANASDIGGWAPMYETETLAGLVNASENLFPQASVMIWDSSNDLVAGNRFVPSPNVPSGGACFGVCPLVYCYACMTPDALLLYGGSQNTVWGNTFQSPKYIDGEPLASYAGLAEAESHDLIFNNNFSIDNPTVYLPFDIYTDACPDGYAGQCGPLVPPVYADAWNVTAQPATDVAATVNGVALSGNVLGPGCPTQGGNYWNDYGNALNPTGTTMVNVYNYSEIVGLLPPGSSPIQPSIRTGGDAAPLTLAACAVGPHDRVAFHATGLPSGAHWSVRFPGGDFAVSSSSTISVPTVPGTLRYALGAPAGYGVAKLSGPHHPTQTSAEISGRTTLTVKLGALELLTFAEVTKARWPGLPGGSSWSVTLTATASGGPSSQSASTTGTALSFVVPKGASYHFVVNVPSGYRASPARGTETVPGHSATKKVKFRPVDVLVTP